ncbi:MULTISPECIES: hypothetical protein [unclassified Corynebacterium]|uniref:hypothetical protein n=1 Tax=unclassified Corynebacterium TaxID=2624378 RepID=UPI0030A10854
MSADDAKQELAGSGAADDGESSKQFDLDAVRWMRSRRVALATANEKAAFVTELQELNSDLSERPGNGVGMAMVITFGAMVLAFLAVVIGLFVIELASDLIGNLSEGSGQ